MKSARVGFAVRSGFRSIRSSRWSALAFVLILGLAAGASQAVWTVWELVVERPLPFPQSAQLVELDAENSVAGRPPIIYGREVDFLAREAGSFASLGSVAPKRSVLGERGDARAVRIAELAPGVLRMLRIPPAAGRLFQPEDHQSAESGDIVVVISHRLWRTALGGSKAAVGARVVLDGRPARIVGVMPPGSSSPRRNTRRGPRRPRGRLRQDGSR